MNNKFKVVFNNINEIKEFVNAVSKCSQEMDLKRGRFTVDAKSIMGIMNLGIQNEINLIVYGELSELEKEAIQPYAVA